MVPQYIRLRSYCVLFAGALLLCLAGSLVPPVDAAHRYVVASVADMRTTGSTTVGNVLSAGAGGALAWITPTAGTVTSVTGTSPIASSGGATPAISIQNADATHTGALTSGDWTTFNGKLGSESDTLASVTGRGASTTTAVTISANAGLTVNDSFPSNVFIANSTGVDAYQLLKARNGFRVGASGTTINKIQVISETIDLASIAANTTVQEDITPAASLPNTVRGIFMGCVGLEHGLVVQSMDGTNGSGHLLFRVSNLTAGPIDAASHTYQFMIVDG